MTSAPAEQRSLSYLVELRNPENLTEYGGRLPAGAVVRVDRETASRWFDKRIAKPAQRGAPTYADIKRAEREAAWEMAEEARILREAKEAEVLAQAAEDGAVLPTATLRRLGMRVGPRALESFLSAAAETDDGEDAEGFTWGQDTDQDAPAAPRRRGRPPKLMAEGE